MQAFFRGSTVALGVILLVSGCGEGEEADAEQPAETGNAVELAERTAEAFVPAADQFGVEQFKVVFALEGQQTGTRTMWVEDYGARVGMEDSLTVYTEQQHKLYYWDGSQSHLLDLPDGEVYSTGIRTRDSEPTSFATTAASDLELVGYERLGEKTLVGQTCEHVWPDVRALAEHAAQLRGLPLEQHRTRIPQRRGHRPHHSAQHRDGVCRGRGHPGSDPRDGRVRRFGSGVGLSLGCMKQTGRGTLTAEPQRSDTPRTLSG